MRSSKDLNTGYLRAEVDRLRAFAEATDRRHKAIREHMERNPLPVGSAAWDERMTILAILDGPPAPDQQ